MTWAPIFTHHPRDTYLEFRRLGDYLRSAVVTIPVTATSAVLATGDGQAYYRVPSTLDGRRLTAVAAHVSTVSSSGLPTVQLRNATSAVDMLSTKCSVDANEHDSLTAATPAVINPANAAVKTGDEINVDVDVAGTGTKGLLVELQFG